MEIFQEIHAMKLLKKVEYQNCFISILKLNAHLKLALKRSIKTPPLPNDMRQFSIQILHT